MTPEQLTPEYFVELFEEWLAKVPAPDNRWPIIRHVRAIYYAWRLGRELDRWRRAGLCALAQPEDEQFIYDVWDGKR
jgi:hypothetical protein